MNSHCLLTSSLVLGVVFLFFSCSDVVAGLEEVVLDQGCRPRAFVKGD